ncbi:MAG: hypothetical protein IJA75_03390 [Oscillospiraceae bacterium]|nr:hypothetical protein [Oscillospiraceae bacterium]
MKKTYLLLAALSLCIVLLACGADPTSHSVGAAASAEHNITVPVEQPISIPAEDYSHANMQKDVPSGNFMRFEDIVLFSSRETSMLYMYDIKTGEVDLFCKDATCTHCSGSCAAAGVRCNLERYNGTIYGSSGPGPVMELRNGRFEPVIDETVSHFWHSDGNLYVVSMDNSLLVYENGSRTPLMVVEEYSGYWETIFDGYLYFESGANVNRIALRAEQPQQEILVENADFLTDGAHIYYTPYQDQYLYRCNMDGSGSTLIFDKPVLASRMSFDKEYFYFLLYTDYTNLKREDGADIIELYRFPKDDPTQINMIAELDATDGAVYTVPGWDSVFVVCRSSSGEEVIYVVDGDGGAPQPLILPDY